MKKLVILMVLFSFVGMQIFSIDIKYFQLSPYRIIIILIAFLLMCTYLVRPLKINILPSSEGRKIVLFYCFWLGYSIVSLLWVKDYGSWIKAIYFITTGLLSVIYITIFIKRKHDFVAIFNVMNLMILLHNLIGWYEVITSDYRFVDKSSPDYYLLLDSQDKVPVSMMGNTNDFALLATFGVFISYICFVANKSIFWKFVSIITMCSCICLVLISGSRANIIGLIMGFGVLIILGYKKNKFVKRITFTVILLATILGVLKIRNDLWLIISDKLQFDFSTQTNSDAVRVNLIKNGFVFLKSTFGFGTGAGNVEYWMKNYAVYNTYLITNMHNWWMELLTGYGVIVFGGYIWMYIKLAKGFYTSYVTYEDKIVKSISIGILCCMSAFFIGSVSSSSNIKSEWLWVFWSTAIAFYCYIKSSTNIKALSIIQKLVKKF